MAHSIEESIPVAGPPSQARIRAAVARIVRHHARAADRLEDVFGDETAAVTSLARRVSALRDADRLSCHRCAESLHQLATWLAAAAESIEMESPAAADLHADLVAIVEECAWLAAA